MGKFQAFLSRSGDQQVEGDWVKLAECLRQVGEPASRVNQAIRYVTPGWEMSWAREGGGNPRLHQDYKRLAGRRGGGANQHRAGGPIYVRKDFAKQVYVRKYSQRPL